METQTQTPPTDLPAQACRHLMHTLIALLPPPIEDTPEATLTRNHAAIARMAALAPVNADEAELAAQCVAARAQAEDLLRLIRLHDSDINIVIKLNAQYAAMVRASLSAHNRLLRTQQQRRKRETTHSAADHDESTRHAAAQAMLGVLATAPGHPSISKEEIESRATGSETPKRRRQHDPVTVARVNAHIDAAIRAAGPNRCQSGLPFSNNAPRHRSPGPPNCRPNTAMLSLPP